MSKRDSAPNAAFACVTEIKGKKHRLLMHHDPDRVQDGMEHDTVDVEMLKASLNLVEQLDFIDESERDAIRNHLRSHAKTVNVLPQPNDIDDSQKDSGARRDLENDPDMARRVVSEKAGGPSGNQNLTSPRVDETLDDDAGSTLSRRAEEALRQESGTGSITNSKSTPTKEGEKSTENPAKTRGQTDETKDVGPTGPDVDTKVKPQGGSDKVSETSEGRGENPGQHTEMPDDKLVNNPNADQQAEARVAEKSTPTKKGKEPAKTAKAEMEDDKTPYPEGKDVQKKK